MYKVKELKIDSPLWATPARLVNLLDFKIIDDDRNDSYDSDNKNENDFITSQES